MVTTPVGKDWLVAVATKVEVKFMSWKGGGGIQMARELRRVSVGKLPCDGENNNQPQDLDEGGAVSRQHHSLPSWPVLPPPLPTKARQHARVGGKGKLRRWRRTIDNNDDNVGGAIVSRSRFMSLPWIECQLVWEWRTYMWEGEGKKGVSSGDDHQGRHRGQ